MKERRIDAKGIDDDLLHGHPLRHQCGAGIPARHDDSRREIVFPLLAGQHVRQPRFGPVAPFRIQSLDRAKKEGRDASASQPVYTTSAARKSEPAAPRGGPAAAHSSAPHYRLAFDRPYNRAAQQHSER